MLLSSSLQSFKNARLVTHARQLRRPQTNAPYMDKLDLYQTLKYPLMTESAVKLIKDDNTLVFMVDTRADKTKIKAAVKELYSIQTKKVNTLMRPDFTKKAYMKFTPDFDAADVAKKIGIV